ncbi:MAG: phosphoribosylamine--glycine ligase [Fimbriimonadaceae bacterium]|nr:phosphoribosylamine--glycine ligase [Fimbriimonadaceae bacterium]
MRALVVGSGAREHALCWKLAHEGEVLCAPGNAGVQDEFPTFDVSVRDHPGLVGLARRTDPDFVVVGAEDPLVEGLADAFRSAGFPVVGPGQAWARIEGSKAFSKDLMASAGVPTARALTTADPGAALAHVRREYAEGRQVAVKADGTALGKGVVVCDTLEQAEDAVERFMVHGEIGDSGRTLVLEERLVGREFSLICLCNETGFQSLPVAQDYKRAFDGDEGPNTGGMGAYSPVTWVSEDAVRQTEDEVVAPLLAEVKRRGGLFRGVLFAGLMATAQGVKCLEYNVRFGDPEIETLVRRLGAGFADALASVANGWPLPAVDVSPEAAVTVMVASGGYPGAYEKGKPVTVGRMPDGVVVFHAGTAYLGDEVVTAGGRVLAVTATGSTVGEARELAYRGVAQVSFDGMQHRSDIASS